VQNFKQETGLGNILGNSGDREVLSNSHAQKRILGKADSLAVKVVQLFPSPVLLLFPWQRKG